MNAQEKVKNDKSNFQTDTLSDLPVTDEQAGETKGGAFGGHVKVFDGQSGALLR